MKIKDLIKQLKQFDKETIVVMSSDSEGNSYSPLSSFCEGFYAPENSWSGTFFTEEDVKEDDEGYFTEEIQKEAVKCVVIWPVN